MNQTRPRGILIAAVLLGVVVFFAPNLSSLYVDWLWFGELRQRPVFWGLLVARAELALFFGLTLALLAYANLALARRGNPRAIPRINAPEWYESVNRLAQRSLFALLAVGSIVLGLLGAVVAGARWDDWIRFQHAQRFSVADPIFHQDAGFYVFRLPFLQFLAGWLFGIFLIVAALTAAAYYLDGALDFATGQARIARPARAHLSVLLGCALLARAAGYWLDRYGLLLKPGHVLVGAGYADVHARLPALQILAVIALVAALAFFANAAVRAMWLPALAVALMLVTRVTLGDLYPGAVQRFQVAPNEATLELPYLQHFIDFTRRAYGLESIHTGEFDPTGSLTAAQLRTEAPTLQNVRLWDYRWLGRTYQGLQRLRNYYDVSDVDVDRYVVGGRYREVMLAPRQFVTGGLEAGQRSWVSRTLQFTHGYGFVMSAVSDADPQGRPVWFTQDLPLRTAPGIEVRRPQIYYGTLDNPPVIAPSAMPEFDYTGGGETVTSRYEGPGGIPVGAGPLRTFFSSYLGNANVLISSQVQPQSRVLLRRHVRDRVAALAPFLEYDRDPYLVLVDGRLVWLQDAYTTSATFPYSEPTLAPPDSVAAVSADDNTVARSINYVRNSVKAAIDAYTGEVTLYGMDDQDPVLRAYRAAFPGLFHPASEMPAGLRAHVRYPEDLFSLQCRKLNRFHVTQPGVFYRQEDVWEIPSERLQEREEGAGQLMEPYYVMMRLPGETQAEFVLVLPFKTRQGTTMAAWLAGRCDGPNAGQLRLYRFPTNSQVDSPEQVDSSIFSDVKVSPEVSLLSQKGSTVHYGNLLVVPVGKSLLYVKPLFVEGAQQGDQGGIPLLKQVILAQRRGDEMLVVMRPSMREALAALVGGPAPAANEPPPPTAPGATAPSAPPAAGVPALAAEAEEALAAAEQAQRAGNWAEYGRQLERARTAVRRLRAATQGERKP